jgi:dihydroxyacetone kinase DhaKLM complex PTS-EIIA-like component DhaM
VYIEDDAGEEEDGDCELAFDDAAEVAAAGLGDVGSIVLTASAFCDACTGKRLDPAAVFRAAIARHLLPATADLDTSALVRAVAGMAPIAVRKTGGGGRLQGKLREATYGALLAGIPDATQLLAADGKPIALGLVYTDLVGLGAACGGAPGAGGATPTGSKGARLLAGSGVGAARAACETHGDWTRDMVVEQLLGKDIGDIDTASISKCFWNALVGTRTGLIDAAAPRTGHLFSLRKATGDGARGGAAPFVALLMAPPSRSWQAAAGALGQLPMVVPELGVGANGQPFAVMVGHAVVPTPGTVAHVKGQAAHVEDARFSVQVIAWSGRGPAGFAARDGADALAELERAGFALTVEAPGLDDVTGDWHGGSLARLQEQWGEERAAQARGARAAAPRGAVARLFLEMVNNVHYMTSCGRRGAGDYTVRTFRGVGAFDFFRGGDPEEELRCAAALVDAFVEGLLLPTAGVVVGASLLSTLAKLLHLAETRVSTLAQRIVGGDAEHSEAFQQAYLRVRGSRTYAELQEAAAPAAGRAPAAKRAVVEFIRYLNLKTRAGLHPPGHNQLLIVRPAEHQPPLPVLIVGMPPEDELLCAIALIAAFVEGALATTAIVRGGASLRDTLARLLHVNATRISYLANGVAGEGSSSAKFIAAYVAAGGGVSRYAPRPLTATGATAAAAAVRAFAAYMAARPGRFPPGHAELVAANAGPALPAAALPVPLIVGMPPEDELLCAIALIAAFVEGALATNAIVRRDASLRETLAALLHVHADRITSLACAHVGSGRSSAAFIAAYVAAGGGVSRYAPRPLTATGATAAAAAVRAFAAYMAARPGRFPPGHAELVAPNAGPALPAAGGAPPAAALPVPLIVSMPPEDELLCAIALIAAFVEGALATNAIVRGGASLRDILAALLHVNVNRITSLACANVGSGRSSAAFIAAYAAAGGGVSRYAPQPPTATGATAAAAAVRAFAAYMAARPGRFPPGHEACVTPMI